MWPLVTVSMVATQLSSVVLPEPEGPMMPTNSPGITSKLMSLMACVTESRLPYTFSIWRTDRTGRGVPAQAAGWNVEAPACAGVPVAALPGVAYTSVMTITPSEF